MREFKFRAWDKWVKRMSEPFRIGERFPLDIRVAVGNDDGAIMQYTGLKDKNGKEIYEGDTITAGYWGTVGYYGEDTFLVDFEKGAYRGFMLEYLKDKKERWSHSTSLYKLERIEVIGNIYENPELLKK